MASSIEYNPIVLFSISRVLNTIGYNFIEEGIEWLFTIINENPYLQHIELQINTVYYIEYVMMRYINRHEADIKRTPSLREKIICILSVLVDKGSTIGFLLREDIT